MKHDTYLMARAITFGEKVLVFIPNLDAEAFRSLIAECPVAPVGVVIAVEDENIEDVADIVGKSLVHKDVQIPLVDARTVVPTEFDRFFIPTPFNAAKYTLKLLGEFGIDPARVHIGGRVFASEENVIFKADNKYADLSRDLGVPGALSSTTLLAHIYDCMKWVAENNIEGDLVNLGVWKGWSTKYLLTLLDHFNLKNKKVIAFDTFDGFIDSGEKRDTFSVASYATIEAANGFYRGINVEEVAENLAPFKNFRLIKGDIADTLKDVDFPDGLCFTLFDMDDYTPTAVALPKIYKNTNKGGFFAHDHYNMPSCYEDFAGMGQRLAMDEFLKENYMFNLSGTNIFVKS